MVITVDPSSTGVVATYTISNVHASEAMIAGTSTIRLEAPSGTVFPDNPSFFSIVDATTSSGSGRVTAALSGGGTNVVTFTLPRNVNSGDVLTLRIADVRNPGTPSSTDSITVQGSVTGPRPTAPPPRPVIRDLTAKAGVSKKGTVEVKLRCTVAACKGRVTLTDGKTLVATEKYSVRKGKTAAVALRLDGKGLKLLAGAKHHTIKVTATMTVTGGRTVKGTVTLVG